MMVQKKRIKETTKYLVPGYLENFATFCCIVYELSEERVQGFSFRYCVVSCLCFFGQLGVCMSTCFSYIIYPFCLDVLQICGNR